MRDTEQINSWGTNSKGLNQNNERCILEPLFWIMLTEIQSLRYFKWISVILKLKFQKNMKPVLFNLAEKCDFIGYLVSYFEIKFQWRSWVVV